MAVKYDTQGCDILVAGAGFAGSLTALILTQIGYTVCLVEKKAHPRFAIGESSTPIADMILRTLADTYGLPWLYDFSRYGSWQRSHPEIVCGLKRGFSYFLHEPGKAFRTNDQHRNELLVAASVNDEQSDTNWNRADFDDFLVEKVKASGILYVDHTDIISAEKKSRWQFLARRHGESFMLEASLFLDASGTPDLLERLWDVNSSARGFLTNTYAQYSHFDGVDRWMNILGKEGISTTDYPYDPDHSALHHLLEEGWFWMLRFNNERLSMGLVMDAHRQPLLPGNRELQWGKVLSQYPSLTLMMKKAFLAPEPGKLLSTGRLQRMAEKGYGKGWVALPHTIGFVDPLHSTGIAHTLSGVEKLVKLLAQCREKSKMPYQELHTYERSVMEEMKFVDLLVSGCYKALSNFDLFSTWTMLYFTAAIAYEQKRLGGVIPGCFLEADNLALRNIVEVSYTDLRQVLTDDLHSERAINEFTSRVRKRIGPYNIAGLLDPSARNMYRHTAAEM